MDYIEQFNVLKGLGLIPTGFDSWWSDGKHSMQIEFINGFLIIKNMKKNG